MKTGKGPCNWKKADGAPILKNDERDSSGNAVNSPNSVCRKIMELVLLELVSGQRKENMIWNSMDLPRHSLL